DTATENRYLSSRRVGNASSRRPERLPSPRSASARSSSCAALGTITTVPFDATKCPADETPAWRPPASKAPERYVTFFSQYPLPAGFTKYDESAIQKSGPIKASEVRSALRPLGTGKACSMRIGRCVCLVVGLEALLVTSRARAETRRLAIVVGNNKGTGERP